MDSARQMARDRLRALAREYLDRGDQTGWFEALYAAADGDPATIPWVELRPNPSLVEWLDREAVRGDGRRALVVGCGLGDDAAELARRGFQVCAFDVSATAVKWCEQRWAGRGIEFAQADLLDPPARWSDAFDFVFEAYTLQVLRGEVRRDAATKIARFVRPDGRLLVICRGRDEPDPEGDLPWPLTRSDLSVITGCGLNEMSFEDYSDDEEPPVRRFRALYRRFH